MSILPMPTQYLTTTCCCSDDERRFFYGIPFGSSNLLLVKVPKARGLSVVVARYRRGSERSFPCLCIREVIHAQYGLWLLSFLRTAIRIKDFLSLSLSLFVLSLWSYLSFARTTRHHRNATQKGTYKMVQTVQSRLACKKSIQNIRISLNAILVAMQSQLSTLLKGSLGPHRTFQTIDHK